MPNLTNDPSPESDPTESERANGRRQGQGWYLENKTRDALIEKGYLPHVRTYVWRREVDIVARRKDEYDQDDRQTSPKRVVVSCVDWFVKDITPCRLWRLITMAYTLRAEPVLVRNHRAKLTKTAQEIAEQWRVRDVTYQDIKNGTVLPEPEMPPTNQMVWPAPMHEDVDSDDECAPDYYYDISTPQLEQDSFDYIYRENRKVVG